MMRPGRAWQGGVGQGLVSLLVSQCRSEVRASEGVKVYFDPVSTAAREESSRDLAAQVLHSNPAHCRLIAMSKMW